MRGISIITLFVLALELLEASPGKVRSTPRPPGKKPYEDSNKGQDRLTHKTPPLMRLEKPTRNHTYPIRPRPTPRESMKEHTPLSRSSSSRALQHEWHQQSGNKNITSNKYSNNHFPTSYDNELNGPSSSKPYSPLYPKLPQPSASELPHSSNLPYPLKPDGPVFPTQHPHVGFVIPPKIGESPPYRPEVPAPGMPGYVSHISKPLYNPSNHGSGYDHPGGYQPLSNPAIYQPSSHPFMPETHYSPGLGTHLASGAVTGLTTGTSSALTNQAINRIFSPNLYGMTSYPNSPFGGLGGGYGMGIGGGYGMGPGMGLGGGYGMGQGGGYGLGTGMGFDSGYGIGSGMGLGGLGSLAGSYGGGYGGGLGGGYGGYGSMGTGGAVGGLLSSAMNSMSRSQYPNTSNNYNVAAVPDNIPANNNNGNNGVETPNESTTNNISNLNSNNNDENINMNTNDNNKNNTNDNNNNIKSNNNNNNNYNNNNENNLNDNSTNDKNNSNDKNDSDNEKKKPSRGGNQPSDQISLVSHPETNMEDRSIDDPSVETANEPENNPIPISNGIISKIPEIPESELNNPFSDYNLMKLTEELFKVQDKNLNPHIKVNLQNRVILNETVEIISDEVRDSLLSLNETELEEVATVKALRALYGSYERDSSAPENLTDERKAKEKAFIDEIMKTPVMTKAMEGLSNLSLVEPDETERKDALRRMWFTVFNNNTSSGFERIFLSENLGDNGVVGIQNWLYFAHLESQNQVSYLGWVDGMDLRTTGALLKLNYQTEGFTIRNATIFVGTPPELEIALYTICAYLRPDNWCPVSLGGFKFPIFTHTFQYYQRRLIDLGFPVL